VGRLDIDSEGLLILTNDGEITYKLTHPKFGVKKTYKILVGGVVTEDKLRRFKNGVLLAEGRTKPAQALIVGRQQGKTWMEITISEGKYHQIRRMCARLSLHVDRLIRTKEGGIELGDLEEGEWRKCEADEIEKLRAETA
jgi:pseudouridine synthase